MAENATPDTLEIGTGRLLIVDDDPAAASMLRSGKDEVLTLFEHFGSDFNVQLTAILAGLNQASTHRIDTADSATATSEVWT